MNVSENFHRDLPISEPTTVEMQQLKTHQVIPEKQRVKTGDNNPPGVSCSRKTWFRIKIS
jgi:hypothetical protein